MNLSANQFKPKQGNVIWLDDVYNNDNKLYQQSRQCSMLYNKIMEENHSTNNDLEAI